MYWVVGVPNVIKLELEWWLLQDLLEGNWRKDHTTLTTSRPTTELITNLLSFERQSDWSLGAFKYTCRGLIVEWLPGNRRMIQTNECNGTRRLRQLHEAAIIGNANSNLGKRNHDMDSESFISGTGSSCRNRQATKLFKR